MGPAQYYYEQGNEHLNRGNLDQAISDYTRALEIDPCYAEAYCNRGVAYLAKDQYDQGWEDVKKAQSLGIKTDPRFLEDLCKASGRER